MFGENNGVSRRTALKTTGGSIAAMTLSGLASAEVGDLVRLNVGYGAADGRKAALDAAAEVVREFDFDALTVNVPEQAVEGLSNRTDVRYVEQDGTWQALHNSCGNCGVQSTYADGACHDGSGATVSVIDTGIQWDHEDYNHRVVGGNACVNCWYGCTCSYDWDDDNGHGTHCAGIVHSIAPGASLAGAKVLDYNGSGSWSDIACGIQWTANAGHDVGSISLGGSSGSSTVRDACEHAWDNGVLLVAAAGNSGPCSRCVGYPAAYDTVMAVSAVDCNDNWASFSSQGPQVEITAPGENISSTYPCNSCDTLSGTSMACPQVSGAGAILRAQGYSNSQARRRLRNTADDIGLSSNRQGDGRLNVEAATC
jgi:subtilisin